MGLLSHGLPAWPRLQLPLHTAKLVAPQPCALHRKLVATFLEANGRGYWDASPDQIDKLRQLYTDVEDRIEGV